MECEGIIGVSILRAQIPVRCANYCYHLNPRSPQNLLSFGWDAFHTYWASLGVPLDAESGNEATLVQIEEPGLCTDSEKLGINHDQLRTTHPSQQVQS